MGGTPIQVDTGYWSWVQLVAKGEIHCGRITMGVVPAVDPGMEERGPRLDAGILNVKAFCTTCTTDPETQYVLLPMTTLATACSPTAGVRAIGSETCTI